MATARPIDGVHRSASERARQAALAPSVATAGPWVTLDAHHDEAGRRAPPAELGALVRRPPTKRCTALDATSHPSPRVIAALFGGSVPASRCSAESLRFTPSWLPSRPLRRRVPCLPGHSPLTRSSPSVHASERPLGWRVGRRPGPQRGLARLAASGVRHRLAPGSGVDTGGGRARDHEGAQHRHDQHHGEHDDIHRSWLSPPPAGGVDARRSRPRSPGPWLAAIASCER